MKHFIFILTLFFIHFTWSQEATLSLDRNEFKIGEQAKLTLAFSYANPNGIARVSWPNYEDEICPGVEIVKRNLDEDKLIDSADARYTRTQDFVITVFEEGQYTIPEQEIRLGDSVYYTNSALLKISTVEVDTASKKLYDIKPIYDVNYPFSERSKDWIKENWIWLLIIALLITGFFLWRYKHKRKALLPVEEPIVIIPAHVLALEKLEKLLQEESWKSSEKKDLLF